MADDLEQVAERLSREDFYQHAADLNTMLTSHAVKVPVTVYSMAELDELIGQLQALKADLSYVEAFELHLLQE